MSSRRKSRPVRRLDTNGIGELKPLQLDSASDAVFEDQTYQASLPTPEGNCSFMLAVGLRVVHGPTSSGRNPKI